MAEPNRATSTFLDVLDWWRPRRELSRLELFQLRCVVACSILGLLVALYSLAQSANSSVIGRSLLSLFAAVMIALLAAARFGVATSALAWAGILNVGVFVSLFSLVSSQARLDQLFWLVLLPLGARAVFPRAEPDPHRPSCGGGRPIALGAVAAIALGGLVLIAQANGVHFGQPPRQVGMILMATEHLLFISTVVGMLWVHEITERATLDELRLLRTLVRHCAWCHDVRDDDGSWVSPERYIARHHTAPVVSHGMCPRCFATQHGDN